MKFPFVVLLVITLSVCGCHKMLPVHTDPEFELESAWTFPGSGSPIWSGIDKVAWELPAANCFVGVPAHAFTVFKGWEHYWGKRLKVTCRAVMYQPGLYLNIAPFNEGNPDPTTWGYLSFEDDSGVTQEFTETVIVPTGTTAVVLCAYGLVGSVDYFQIWLPED